MLIQRLFAGIALIGMLLPVAVADDATFERAVSVYLRGFEECVNAHTLRGKNIQQAKRKYQDYLRIKDEAAAIDPSILTTTERSMQKNLRYCEKVQQNILRAEAMPIMEAGLEACEKADEAMEAGNFQEAKSQMDIYEQSKTEALLTTESILEVFSVASKVRLCGRIASKIGREQEQMDEYLNAAAKVIAALEDAQANCQQVTQLAANNALNVDNIETANKFMNQSQKSYSEGANNKAVSTGMDRYPEHETTVTINGLLESIQTCQESAGKQIAQAEQNRNQLQQQISIVLDAASKANQQCRTASNMLNDRQFQFEQLSKIQWHQNESNRLETKAKGEKKGLATAKQFPDWNSSRQLSKTLNDIENCQQRVARLIDSKQQEWLAIKEAEAKRKAEEERQRIAKLEMEKKKEAEQRKEDEAEQQRDPTPVDDSNTAASEEGKKKGNISRSWLDLLPGEEEGDVLAEEDYDDEPVEEESESEPNRGGSSIQRSWTDLIPDK